MEQIIASESGTIAEITSMIETIAFQTSILALDAALAEQAAAAASSLDEQATRLRSVVEVFRPAAR